MRVGVHCFLFPPPSYAIHPPLTDIVLGESVNCISEIPDTRNSANWWYVQGIQQLYLLVCLSCKTALVNDGDP